MNKRGIVFLFSAILLVLVMLSIMYAKVSTTTNERDASVFIRISSMNSFIEEFHTDVPRATFISASRSLIALEQHISDNGAFRNDTEQVFRESFVNGTIDGSPFVILENSTFSDYLQRVQIEAASSSITLNATIGNITLSQHTPWQVRVHFPLQVNVTDTRGLAGWSYNKTFDTLVSIVNLRDPVYSVGTSSKVPNTIRRSPYENEDFVINGNDTTALYDEISNMYYREDPYAPSFLQRFQGLLNESSPNGIASLVDLDELNAQDVEVYTLRPTLDYLYFNESGTATYCPDFGSPLQSWFRLDNNHFTDEDHDYELPDLNGSVC